MKEKDLKYWKENAEEDYNLTPISVLRYITELEEAVNKSDIIDNVSDCHHSRWWKLKNTVIGTICLKCRYGCR